jgi:voltage-gated sodium channel
MIWIGYDTEINKAQSIVNADPLFRVVENVFCAFFTAEVSIRFLSFQKTIYAFQDAWFRFDFFITGCMVCEAWIFPLSAGQQSAQLFAMLVVMRLLRFMRILRLVRVIRAVPELVTLITATVAAFRSVASTMLLLLIILYMFSIFFTYNLSVTLPTYFGTVTQSMMSLLFFGTFLDECSTAVGAIEAVSTNMLLCFLLYTCCTTLTVLNMLVGVMCQVFTAVSDAQRDKMAISYIRSTIAASLREVDMEEDGYVNFDEFTMLLHRENIVQALEELSVDVEHFATLGEHLFLNNATGEMDGKISQHEFLEMVPPQLSHPFATA